MAIYTPIVDALSELGADDIGKVVGKVGSVGGRILLHQISKHTGIDLSAVSYTHLTLPTKA